MFMNAPIIVIFSLFARFYFDVNGFYFPGHQSKDGQGIDKYLQGYLW